MRTPDIVLRGIAALSTPIRLLRPAPSERRTGKKLAATVALLGALGTAGVLTAAPASADVGIGLSNPQHNVGVYGYYNVGSTKVAKDLLYAEHDGIDADCWSLRGQDVVPGNHLWYHTIAEYHNTQRYTQSAYGWTYAYYVDYGRAKSYIPDCGY